MQIKPKPKGKELGKFLEIRTLTGTSGEVFLVMKVGRSYHAYREVTAKDVAVACGAGARAANTRTLMKKVFGK